MIFTSRRLQWFALVGILALGIPLSVWGVEPSKKNFGKVELLRDTWGVPHIFADSDAGAMYGLGQAVAEDRGFQMNYNLRMIQGRLSEVLGASVRADDNQAVLEHDRKMRTIGFYRAAQAITQKLDPQTLRILQSYSLGVNAWFAGHRDRLHPLFAKLSLEPEPWTPADCIASWWHLGQYFSGDGLDKLDNYRSVSQGLSIAPPPSNLIFDDSASVVLLEDVQEEWVARARQYQRERGYVKARPGDGTDSPSFSHAWVVGGKRTTTGSAVLVSDPQVPVCNPSLFYEFHVCGKTMNVRGVGVPGSPGLLIGFNEYVAWGVTALGADQADLFRLKTDDQHPNQYMLDGKWQHMQLIRETIRVKHGEPIELTIRHSQFGPVVTPFVSPQAGDPEVSLKRVPQCETASETIQGVLRMMQAQSLDEFTKGLALWQFPSVNMIFGDKQGNVGYWMQAAIPARSKNDPYVGQVAHDGSQSMNDWQGFIPHDLLPHVVNPQRGWIASGNHRPIGSFYPIGIMVGKGSNGHTLRSWRLYERLSKQNVFSPEEVLAIHFDDTNPMRRDVVRVGLHLRDTLKVTLSADASSAVKHLEVWFRAGAQSDMNRTGAALAEEINVQFRANATPLAAKFGGGQAGLKRFLVDVTDRINRDPQAALDSMERELFDTALASAWKSANEKYGADATRWDELARAQVKERRRGYFEGLSGFGSLDASSDLRTPELACIDGATIKSQGSQGYTQFVPLDNVDAAQSILPPGESERIDSPWRTSNWELWEQGRMHPAPLSRSGVQKIVSHTTVLGE